MNFMPMGIERALKCIQCFTQINQQGQARRIMRTGCDNPLYQGLHLKKMKFQPTQRVFRFGHYAPSHTCINIVRLYIDIQLHRFSSNYCRMKDDEFEKALDGIIAELIKIRKNKGISHEKLTELSGLSRTAISYIESRKSTPSIISLMKICKALDVKLSGLLK